MNPNRTPALREIELKLEMEPGDVASIKRRLGELSVTEPVAHTLVSLYFDTPRWTLREHRVALRVRHGNHQYVQTVKSSDGLAAGLYDRVEWQHAIQGPEPELSWTTETALGPLLNDRLAASLRPVFETRIRRIEYRLTRPAAVIAAALDYGIIRAGSRHCRLCELELELLRGAPSALFSVAKALQDVAPMHLSVKTKADRGYELLQGKGSPEPMPPQSARPSPTATAGRAFQTIARGCLRQLIANEKAVLARDGAALHRMRVALRQLRSAISVFSEVIGDGNLARIRSELRSIGRQLGAARDLDVFIAEVVGPLHERYPQDRKMSRICRNFGRRRALAYRRVATSLQSARFRHLEFELARWIEAGSWVTSPTASAARRRDRPVTRLAAETLARGRKKLRKTGQPLTKLSRKDRHRMRIRAKKLRYAVEFFSSVFPGKKPRKRCEESLSALRDLQDSLGALNDLARREVIRSHGRPSTTAAGAVPKAFAARVSFGAQGPRVAQLLQEAECAFKRFCGVKPFWD